MIIDYILRIMAIVIDILILIIDIIKNLHK